jgi:hypothetical protein
MDLVNNVFLFWITQPNKSVVALTSHRENHCFRRDKSDYPEHVRKVFNLIDNAGGSIHPD